MGTGWSLGNKVNPDKDKRPIKYSYTRPSSWIPYNKQFPYVDKDTMEINVTT